MIGIESGDEKYLPSNIMFDISKMFTSRVDESPLGRLSSPAVLIRRIGRGIRKTIEDAPMPD